MYVLCFAHNQFHAASAGSHVPCVLSALCLLFHHIFFHFLSPLSCHAFPKRWDAQPGTRSTRSGSADKLHKLHLTASGPSSAAISATFINETHSPVHDLKNLVLQSLLVGREATANKSYRSKCDTVEGENKNMIPWKLLTDQLQPTRGWKEKIPDGIKNPCYWCIIPNAVF